VIIFYCFKTGAFISVRVLPLPHQYLGEFTVLPYWCFRRTCESWRIPVTSFFLDSSRLLFNLVVLQIFSSIIFGYGHWRSRCIALLHWGIIGWGLLGGTP